MGIKHNYVTFRNAFHNVHIEVRVNVEDGVYKIAGSTAKQIRRRLCGVTDCTCGHGECGTRSGPCCAYESISSYVGSDLVWFQEEPVWSMGGDLIAVRLVPRN